MVDDPRAEAEAIARQLAAAGTVPARIKAKLRRSALGDLHTALCEIEVDTEATALSDPEFDVRARAEMASLRTDRS